MILKDQSFCPACGTMLEERKLENEGMAPYCPACAAFRFPQYNVAVSMIVRIAPRAIFSLSSSMDDLSITSSSVIERLFGRGGK